MGLGDLMNFGARGKREMVSSPCGFARIVDFKERNVIFLRGLRVSLLSASQSLIFGRLSSAFRQYACLKLCHTRDMHLRPKLNITSLKIKMILN